MLSLFKLILLVLTLVRLLFVIKAPPSFSVSCWLCCTHPSRLVNRKEKKPDTPRGFIGGGEEVGAVSLGLYNTPLVPGIHKFPSIRPFFLDPSPRIALYMYKHFNEQRKTICGSSKPEAFLIPNRKYSSCISGQLNFDKSLQNPLWGKFCGISLKFARTFMLKEAVCKIICRVWIDWLKILREDREEWTRVWQVSYLMRWSELYVTRFITQSNSISFRS